MREGNTRDFLETDAVICGIPVRLFDTAGLRDDAGEVEKEGIRRTKNLMENADLVVYVLDGDEVADLPDDVLAVRSKRDITGIDSPLSFSSVTGEGIPEVLEAIADRLLSSSAQFSDVPHIDSERQREKLLEAAEALEDAEKAVCDGEDVVAMYLQSALTSLAELTGAVTGEDVLDRLFSSFCLGK